MTNARLSEEEIKHFLVGETLYCYLTDTGPPEATIVYREDGSCHAHFKNGQTDEGRYGFNNDMYWTKYQWFRDGGLNHFYLLRIDEITAQAYYEDGKRAFRQKRKNRLVR